MYPGGIGPGTSRRRNGIRNSYVRCGAGRSGLWPNPIVHARPVWFASKPELQGSSIIHDREESFHTAWNGPIGSPTPNSSSAGAKGNAVRLVWNAMEAVSLGPEVESPMAS